MTTTENGESDPPIEGIYVFEIEVTGATKGTIDTLMGQLIEVIEASPMHFEGASGGPLRPPEDDRSTP